MRSKEVTDEGGSERTCIATGAKGAPETMLQFALSPDGVVTPDLARKLPGRGVWTRISREAVARAAAKKAFARAFRAPAEAPADLADRVDALLQRAALQALSIANKAGLVVSGAFKVDEAVKNTDVVALIQAADGAADGLAKREQALRARLGEAAGQIARIKVFPTAQLDLALGKANVVHAALKSGAASSAFLAKAEVLRCYRASEANTATQSDRNGAPVDGDEPPGRPDEMADGPGD